MPRNHQSLKLIQFAMSDDLRAEQFGKFTLIGWYAGNSIKLHRPVNTKASDWKPQLPSIAYSLVIEGGPGEIRAEFELLAPSGKSVMKVDLGTAKFEKLDRAALLLKAPPTAITEFGIYQAMLRASGETIATPISVRKGDPMGQLVQGSPTSVASKGEKKRSRSMKKRAAPAAR